MKILKSEKGYALFLTVLIIVLFGILTVSLLTIVMSGVSKNTIREDVTQAGELSEKGLQRITNQINHDIQNNIPEKGVSETQFITLFEHVLQHYQCPEAGTEYPVKAAGETGTYQACVDRWEDESESGTLKKVVIKSTGTVNGKEKTIETTVLMGADGYPVPLKYVLSTNASEACQQDAKQCTGGEGNLFIHGSPTIKGNMKVDRNLIVSDMAFTPARAEDYLLKEAYWIESILPDAKDSEIELGGSIYKYELPNHLKGYSLVKNREKLNAYNAHISRDEFRSSEYKELDNIADAFQDHAPIIEEKELFRDDVKITEIIEKFKYHYTDPGVIQINSADFKLFEGHRTFKNLKNSRPLYGYFCAKGIFFDCFLNLDRTYTGKFYLVGNNNHFHKFAVSQDLHIGRELTDIFNEGIKIKINDQHGEQGGIYVGRDLIIGRGLTSNLEASVAEPNLKIEIDGNIFVNGDLTITGVDGKFNSIIYVNGDVTIDRSRFSGLNKNGEDRALIIFANGKIKIVKNRLFRNEPDVLKGFFYSKEGIEIYGSASNLKIEGGLSAPRIVLNSIRGRAGIGGLLGVIKPFKPSQHYVFGYYETRNNQVGKPSRLQLEYDEAILNTYSDLSVDQYIYNVVKPVILDRSEL